MGGKFCGLTEWAGAASLAELVKSAAVGIDVAIGQDAKPRADRIACSGVACFLELADRGALAGPYRNNPEFSQAVDFLLGYVGEFDLWRLRDAGFSGVDAVRFAEVAAEWREAGPRREVKPSPSWPAGLDDAAHEALVDGKGRLPSVDDAARYMSDLLSDRLDGIIGRVPLAVPQDLNDAAALVCQHPVRGDYCPGTQWIVKWERVGSVDGFDKGEAYAVELRIMRPNDDGSFSPGALAYSCRRTMVGVVEIVAALSCVHRAVPWS